MTRLEIDLNSRTTGGLTLGRLSRIEGGGTLHANQLVTVFESEDEVQALAMVDHVDQAAGYVFLRVNWESLRHDDGSEQGVASFSSQSVNRAQARTVNQRANNATAGTSNRARRGAARTASLFAR